MTNETRPPASSSPPQPPDDPTVEEIREIRRRQWQAADRDVQKYIRQSREAADRIRSSPTGQEQPQRNPAR